MSRPKKKTGIQDTADAASVMVDTDTYTVDIAGHGPVSVYKCKAKNVGTILEFIAFVLEEFGIETLGEMPAVKLDNPQVILPMIAKSSGRLIHIASELCNLSTEEVLELELDDAISLIIKVVEVNKDFFLKSVLPQLQFMKPKAGSTQ